MPSKDFILSDDLVVTVNKRRRSRYLRLSITPTGQARVSIPAWAPYKAGVDFAKQREDWIRGQRVATKPLRHGQAVGKAHHLQFVVNAGASGVKTRLAGTAVTVRHPADTDFDHPDVQKAAQTACIKALRRQAEQLLPGRLKDLADAHGFDYGLVRIKHMKSRWGSCDQDKHITLNLFLMQLPWDLIDYVLLHELTHTRILRHGPGFWQAMGEILPDARARKKLLRDYHPVLLTE